MKAREWVAQFERNTPSKYPVLHCGWPDIEHGITHDAYIASCIAALEDVYENEDAPAFSSFKEWVERMREENEDRDNLGFSWQDCDLCGALAGHRYAVTGYPESFPDCDDYIALEVCGDCLCYIANGDVPCDLEEEDG
jgi:hypothetical protein